MKKLSRILLLFTLFASMVQTSVSAGIDSNIVISNGKELHEFVWSKAVDSVKVKQTITRSYSSNSFSSPVQINEVFNNQVSIDGIELSINNGKTKNVNVQSVYYGEQDVFFSDRRICSFVLPFKNIAGRGTVQIRRTINDPRFFTTVFFGESYKVDYKEVSFKVPRWMKVELKEINFSGFSITKDSVYLKTDDADIFTYIVRNLRPVAAEENRPDPSYTEPHILVLAKEASLQKAKVIYLNTVADQYRWYRQLISGIGSDLDAVKSKAIEITAGKSDDLEKIRTILHWVQSNIRYIAFEDGLAAFKPDRADEVIRKKYGDCKGMANLTKELLTSLGYDARLCWIGTNNIAYDFSTPSIAINDHMICALQWQGKTYFLDATETYMSLNEYAERIQGRPCLVEDGDNYILTKIPSTGFRDNTDQTKEILFVKGSNLTGDVTRKWSGEAKELMLLNIHGTKKQQLAEATASYLSKANPDHVITKLKTSDVNDIASDFSASYSVVYKNAVSVFGKDHYFSVDHDKGFAGATIDTSTRGSDYWFPFKRSTILEIELLMPEGAAIKRLPTNLEINNEHYQFSITYSMSENKIVYRKSLVIKDARLIKNMFPQWNKHIKALLASSNEQIVFTSK